MYLVTLASVAAETGAPDLVIASYTTLAETLEAINESADLDDGQRERLDVALTALSPGEVATLRYHDPAANVAITFGTVARAPVTVIVDVDDDDAGGDLHNYATGAYLRPATVAERDASAAAAEVDGGAGVILVGGVSCYVVD
jgi:hypothetical protein